MSTAKVRPPRNKDVGLHKYSTVDATYKLIGSLPPPREGRSVPTMDKFVSMELHGKIVYERRSVARSRSLGFFLDLIFAGFAKEFADVVPESLVVPLSSIPSAVRKSTPSQSPNRPDDSRFVQLYDKENRRWQWDFTQSESHSSSNTLNTPQSLSCEQLVALFFNSITDAFTACQAKAGKSLTHRRQWLANWSKTSLPGSTGYSRKPDLVLVDNDLLSHDEMTWLSPKVIAEYTKEKFQPASRIGKTMDTKAYLVLVDQPWRRFILGLSIANCDFRVHLYDHSGSTVSPPFNIHADAQHFLFIVVAFALGCRASIGFDYTIEIHPPALNKRRRSARKIALGTKDTKDGPDALEGPSSTRDPDDDLDSDEGASTSPLTEAPDPIHDHLQPSPPEPLFPPTIDIPSTSADLTPAIGRIRIDDVYYDIIDILFSTTGFVGRGTVCYLARYKGVYFVIKDQWVRDLDQGVGIRDPRTIHEARMMEIMKDVDGVPKLHKAWVVEVEEGVPDTTPRYREERFRGNMVSPRTHIRLAMTPCARPLTSFKSKKELVRCIRDVLGIIQQALERGVLHRDCSLLNTMIEDLPDGTSRGVLLDWEFAVEITKRGEYNVGGTGTLPFMSVNILRQLDTAFAKSAAVTAQSIRKTASLTRVFINDPISIRHTYADDVESLLYVLTWVIVMYEGPGHERDIGHEKTFLGLWSEKAATDLAIARHAKFAFLCEPINQTLDDAVTPYWRDLIPLIHRWRSIHSETLSKDTIPFQISDVAQVLDDFIARMPEEHRPAEMSMTLNDLQVAARQLPNVKKSSLPSPPVATSFLNDSYKRLRDEVRSMDNPPMPGKRFKSGG